MSSLGILRHKISSQFIVSFVVIIIIQLNLGLVQGAKCPGICTNNATQCKHDGGKIIGWCTNSKACCDLTVNISASCGQSFGNESDIIHFKSPHYPKHSANDLLCDFSFKLQDGTVGVLLEFHVFESDGVRFGPASFDCDVDHFFITGFTGWAPPPLCGFLENYKMMIDKGKMDGMDHIKFVAVMSSLRYRWHIKIRQIHKSDCLEKDFHNYKTQNFEPNFESTNNTTHTNESSTSPLDSTTKTTILYSDDAYGNVENPNKHRDQYERIQKTTGKRNRRDVENGESMKSLDSNNIKEDENNINQLNFDRFSRGQDGLKLQPLVVNGDDVTTDGKVPWQASIRYDLKKLKKLFTKGTFALIEGSVVNCDVDEGLHICGGTIISDREILTAAHCFASHTTKNRDAFPIYSIKVVLGDMNNCRDSESRHREKILKNSTSTSHHHEHSNGTTTKHSKKKYRNPNVQEFGVESVTLHYAYDRVVIMNDVAIIRLNDTIKFNKNVHSIDMARKGEDFTDEPAFVSGFGQTNFTNPNIHEIMPHVLQYSDNLQIKPKSFCKAHSIRYLQSTEMLITQHKKYSGIFQSVLCSGSNNKSRDVLVGPGDSGGPLVVFDPDSRASKDPVLVGIVSYGNPIKRKLKQAAGDFVDYFQSVSYYRKWINLAVCAIRG